MKDGVLVTGIGIISPIKPFKGLNEFWDALCSGEDTIRKSRLPILDNDKEWLMARIDLSSSITPEDKFQYLS